MKKFIFLLLTPVVSFAQNDSIQTNNKNNVIITCKKCDNSKKPLYLVEGKLISESEVEKINADEIESINVLKGEKAIEKYGDEGKNSVIEIQLKKKISVSEILETKIPVYDLVNSELIFDSTSFMDLPTLICFVEGKPIKKIREEYDLAVLDLGYESFLAMQPSAATYSLSYLQNRNQRYVSVWNQRVISGNPEIYEMPIDYDSKTYYGLDFEYKLYMFFKFMEDKYQISFT